MHLENHHWIWFIVAGVFTTLKYAILSVLGGTTVGIVISLLRLSGNSLAKTFAAIYVSLIRGTPLYLQLSLIYLVLPRLMGGVQISLFVAGIAAFSLNSGAYVSEIIRAGINSVDKGQWEAAKALAIPRYRMLRDIIFPQALVKVLPALVNESVNMVKESAIIAAFGELDLMRRAQIVCSETYTYLGPYIAAGACYYIIVLALSTFASSLEARIHAQNN